MDLFLTLDFYEDAKLLKKFSREMREYFSKHPQWNGSYSFLSKAERDACEYSKWVMQRSEVKHRLEDPRGSPLERPTRCICDKPLAMKKCKRVGAKGNKANLGRHFYVCDRAKADDGAKAGRAGAQ